MVVAFEVPQTSKKLLKSCRAQSMYMRTSVWKAFLSSVTSAEKSKFNKDVILNTELLLCLVWSYLLFFTRIIFKLEQRMGYLCKTCDGPG